MKKLHHESNLREIPGVGPSIERDLLDIGINRVEDLKGRRPDELYDKLCGLRKKKIDRCVLYVFRCAVYYAGTGRRDPELLKWWNWKDR